MVLRLLRTSWFRIAAGCWLAALLIGAVAVQPPPVRIALAQALGLGGAGEGAALLVLLMLAGGIGYAIGHGVIHGVTKWSSRVHAARKSRRGERVADVTAAADGVAITEEDEPQEDEAGNLPRVDEPTPPSLGGLRGAWLMQTGEILAVPADRAPLAAGLIDQPPPPDEVEARDLPTLDELEQRLANVLARIEREAHARARRPAMHAANDHEPPLLDAAAQEAVALALAQLEAVTSRR